MNVSAQYVGDHIAELLVVANKGEKIQIALDGKPTLKLLRMSPASPKRNACSVLVAAS